MPQRCLFSGCLCTYQAFDCDEIVVGCKGAGDCLCLGSEFCCAVGEEPYACGSMDPDPSNGESCRLGCFFCFYSCIEPSVLCAQSRQCLCCYSAAALPFDDKHMPEPACAYYGCSCAPKVGCCTTPPDCPALGKYESSPAIGVKAPFQGNTSRGPRQNTQSAPAAVPARMVTRNEQPPQASAPVTYFQSNPASAPPPNAMSRDLPQQSAPTTYVQSAPPTRAVVTHVPARPQYNDRRDPPQQRAETTYAQSAPAARTTVTRVPSPARPTEQQELPQRSAETAYARSTPAARTTVTRVPPPARYTERQNAPQRSAETTYQSTPAARTTVTRVPPQYREPEVIYTSSNTDPRGGSNATASKKSKTTTTVVRHEAPPKPEQPVVVTHRPVPMRDQGEMMSSHSDKAVTTEINADGTVTVTEESVQPNGGKQIRKVVYPNTQVAAANGFDVGF